MLRDNGFDYICVRRGMLKDYHPQTTGYVVEVEDNKHQKIRLEKVVCENKLEYYLKIDSEAKRLKECSMNARFQKGFEDDLAKIATSLTKKSGIKQTDKVNERIGRLKGKYPSIHRHYDIIVESELVPDASSKKEKEERTVKGTIARCSHFRDMEVERESGCKRSKRHLFPSYLLAEHGKDTLELV